MWDEVKVSAKFYKQLYPKNVICRGKSVTFEECIGVEGVEGVAGVDGQVIEVGSWGKS